MLQPLLENLITYITLTLTLVIFVGHIYTVLIKILRPFEKWQEFPFGTVCIWNLYLEPSYDQTEEIGVRHKT